MFFASSLAEITIETLSLNRSCMTLLKLKFSVTSIVKTSMKTGILINSQILIIVFGHTNITDHLDLVANFVLFLSQNSVIQLSDY